MKLEIYVESNHILEYDAYHYMHDSVYYWLLLKNMVVMIFNREKYSNEIYISGITQIGLGF